LSQAVDFEKKVAGEWRIKSSKLTRLHVNFVVPEAG
jgi:hypothetical protein